MKDYLVYLLYVFVKFIFRIIPNTLMKQILRILAKIIYKLNKKHKKIARVNLDIAFGNNIKNEKKNEIIYKSYESLLFNMYEFIENQYINKVDLLNKAVIQNEEIITNAIKQKRKIIFVTAHYGGWELVIPYAALKYGNMAVVNRKMNNKYINEAYIKARNRNNIIMLDKKSAAKGMVKALKSGNNVAVAIDQHAAIGINVEFFGKKVSATDATSRLAVKFDALIIPMFAVTKDFRKYTIKVCEPIESKDIKAEDKILALTQIQANVIEKQIKEQPELWFWQHKRWKEFHKSMYE